MCDADSEIVAGQPLKLLPEIQIHFDEILAPGDLLYVPPGLAHYGVAEDDCLTYSFGFRMPNVAEMMDRVSDKFAVDQLLKNPLTDILREKVTSVGQISQTELEYLKTKLLAQLQNPAVLEDALMSLMSESKYPENIPEAEAIGSGDLEQALDQGYSLMLEPASRLLYTEVESKLLFWANGEGICISDDFAPLLKQLADGNLILLDEKLARPEMLEDIVNLLNESILMLLPAVDTE